MKKNLKKYPKCWKTKKIAYPDEDKALLGLKAAWNSLPEMKIGDMNVYECYFCKKWHMGHDSKYKEYLKKHETKETA